MMAELPGYPQQLVAGATTTLAAAPAAAAVGTSATPGTDALLPGWVAARDPTSGKEYYSHIITKHTTWEKPIAAPAQAPAAASSATQVCSW